MNLTTIKKEVVVNASQQTAFEVFTGRIDEWWPKSHHVGKTPMTRFVLEKKQNGRWYSLHEDGDEVNVGYVMTWDPYSKVVLAWQISGDFKYTPELVTEVEVNFVVESPTVTRVLLEHRDLEKLAGGSKVIAEMDGGWGMILNLYKQVTNEA